MTTQVKTTAICNMTVQFTMIFLQGFNVYQSTYVYIHIIIIYIYYIIYIHIKHDPELVVKGESTVKPPIVGMIFDQKKIKVGTVGVPIDVPA